MRIHKIGMFVGVFVVTILLFGVGFFAYNYFSEKNDVPPGFVPAPTGNPQALNPYDPPITPFRELHEKILSLPGPDASEEVRKSYRALIEENAKKQSSVTITDCTADPIVIAVKQGSEVTLKNGGDNAQRIIVNAQNTYSIPANQSTKIKADFGHNFGIYTYSCNDNPMAIGVFLVRETL